MLGTIRQVQIHVKYSLTSKNKPEDNNAGSKTLKSLGMSLCFSSFVSHP